MSSTKPKEDDMAISYQYAAGTLKTAGSDLFETINLGQDQNLSFHWADFSETCEAYKKLTESHPLFHEDLDRRIQGLKKLQMIPIWMKTQNKILQTSMYDLYERYMKGSFSTFDQLDPFDRIELSFMSGTGPFKNMAVAECFNREAYQDFVLVGLLKDKLRKRDFRLRCKTKLLFEYGQDFHLALLVGLEQISTHGFLFSTDNPSFIDSVTKGGEFRFLMDTYVMRQDVNSLDEIRSLASEFPFNLFYSSSKSDAFHADAGVIQFQNGVDFVHTKKSYFFVPFDAFPKNDKRIIETMAFLAKARKLIVDLYQSGFPLTKSA